MYSGMAKGTSRSEVTSNSEKIKSVALTIVELHDSEGIRQLVRSASWLASQLASQPTFFGKHPCAGLTFWCHPLLLDE